MKTTIFITLLVLIPAFAIGQETIQITKKSATGDKETYSVLKSDHSVKQGAYIKRNSYNDIVAEGFYKEGLEDSIWNEYVWKKLTNKGKYTNGLKTGIWSFYDYKGVLELKFDFTDNKLIYFKPDELNKEMIYVAEIGSEKKKVKLDSPPLYLNGSMFISQIYWNNIKYPVLAQENSIMGKVEITVTIDKTGKVSNYRITKKIGGGCDEEALRVVKLLPQNWYPGIYNGENVSVDYVIPVTYKLE